MKKSENGTKKKKIDVLLVLAILLFIVGVALLLVDPIRTYLRNKKAQEGLNVIEAQISENIAANATSEDGQEPVVTFVVPRDDNAINGEEYDYFTDDEDEIAAINSQLEEEMANMPDEVVLNAIGILRVDSVGINISVWDEASRISLRYGGGHFENSVMPGLIGNCTVLAHRTREPDTMFHNLEQVEIGDTIEFTILNGTVYTYVVDDIRTIHAWELEENIRGDITTTRQITLVTCYYTSTEKMRLLVIGHLVNE